MLNKIIANLNNLQEVKFNKIFAEQAITDATNMYNNGWDALEDGQVISTKGNIIIIKKGNTVIKNEMLDFNINMGKLDGNIKREIEIINISEDKKELYLAQAIITKYYTIKRA